jgi:hypothetical protein
MQDVTLLKAFKLYHLRKRGGRDKGERGERREE